MNPYNACKLNTAISQSRQNAADSGKKTAGAAPGERGELSSGQVVRSAAAAAGQRGAVTASASRVIRIPLESVHERRDLAPDLVNAVIARSEGNPFLGNQLLRAMLGARALWHDGALATIRACDEVSDGLGVGRCIVVLGIPYK